MKTIKQQQKALNFIKNAFVYKKDIEKIVFNEGDKTLEQNTFVEQFKDACFQRGMEIQDFDFDCFSEAIDDIDNNYLHKVIISDDLSLEDVINDLENYEFQDIEADVYTSNLLDWLKSDLHNTSYCDEVIDDYEPKTFIDILMYAQQRAKEEKYNDCKQAVIDFLGDYTD